MKVQYDLEGGVLRQNATSKSVSKLALYGVLLIVIVVGWVVYQQGEAQRSKELEACPRTTPVVPVGKEELTTTVVETTAHPSTTEHLATTEYPATTEEFHPKGVDDLIEALFSPFVQSESAVVELKLDTDGVLIKFGENVDNLMELARDSDISSMLAVGLKELLLIGQDSKPGKKVDLGLTTREVSVEVTTAKNVEELWSWTAGNLLEFKFRFEDDHWELEGAAEFSSSSDENNSNEASGELTEDR